jgi:ABC-2 type transport system permease protein
MEGKSIWARVALGANPILVKELRSRMRGVRAFAVLTGVLLLLAGISYLLYRIVLAATQYSNTPVSPQIGQALLAGLAVVELMMVCFVTPAVTAGSISSEQEKLTYEMLLATPLRPASILWGKLISALSYVFLLVFAAVPMASLIFIFGGVALVDMLKALVVLVATAVTLGVVGVFMSAWLGRTVRATVLSYLVVLGLLLGPLLAYLFVAVLRQAEPPRWLLVPNPVSALFSALSPAVSSGGSVNVLGGLGQLLSGNIAMVTGSRLSNAGIPRPLYHYTLPLYGGLSLALYLLATRLVRPSRRWRIRWREGLLALALFLGLGVVVAVPFVLTAGHYERVGVLPTPVPAIAQSMPVTVERSVRVIAQGSPDLEPTPTPGQAPGGLDAPPEDEQTQIYAAVIRQLYTVDHTFEQAPNFPIVYLVRSTQDGIGDPDAPRSDSQVLPEAVQEAVTASLADLPAKLVWVDDRAEVPLDDQTGAVSGGGVIVTVGNIHLDEEGRASVSASLYFANLGAGGRTYVLEQVGGTWQVTGDTGVQWIS